MARRKTDAEVGPLGVWAYNTRDALDLKVEGAVSLLPVPPSAATLRKIEGGSARPGVRMWREIGALYARLAAEKNIDIEPQPRLAPDPAEATVTADPVVAALGSQTAAINALVAEMRAQRELDAQEGSALIRFAEVVASLLQQRAGVEA